MKFLLAAILSLQAGAALADDVMWSTLWVPPSGVGSVGSLRPTSDGGAYFVYARTYGEKETWVDNRVAKFSPTGQLLWTIILDNTFSMSGIQTDSQDNIYVSEPSQYGSGLTRKYSPAGQILWEEPESAQGSLLTAPDGSSYLMSSGKLWKRGADGTLLWEIEIPFQYNGQPLYSVWAESGRIGIGSLSLVVVYDPDGQEVRRHPISIVSWQDGIALPAFGVNSEVYVADGQTLKRYNPDGQLVWQRNVGSKIRDVVCDESRVYVNTVASAHWFDLNGNIVWQGSLPPTGEVIVLDGLGNVWSNRPWYDPPYYGALVRMKEIGGISAVTEMRDVNFSSEIAAGNHSDFFHVSNNQYHLIRFTRYRNGIDHDSAQLVRGRTTENSHWAIMHSSDGYWSIAPGPVFTNQQNPISMIVKHTAPPENPTEMGVTLESRGSVNGVKQSVEVYNFSTSTWTSLESNVVLPFGGGVDRYAILPVPNPVSHIGPGREIRLRVEYRNDSPVFVWPWTARIDREMIRYVK